MIISDGERQAPINIEETEPSHLARYKFALNYISPKDIVLDVPCGSGYGTALLAAHSSKAYGIDIHEGAIEHAHEFFKLNNSSFYVANIEYLLKLFPESGIFNKIVSFEGIEHLRHPNLFLEEAQRLLTNDGNLIISTPRKPHGSPYHIIEYSLEEFTELLSNYFTVNKVFGQLYTDIFDLSKKPVNPPKNTKFNFIAHCSKK